MRFMMIFSMAAATLAAPAAARAASADFTCSAPAAKFSSLDIAANPDDFEISGSIALTRKGEDKKWLPSGQIRLVASDKRDSLAIRLVVEDVRSSVARLYLWSSRDGDERASAGKLLALDESALFSIKVSSRSEVLVTAGGEGVRVPLNLGETPTLTIVCSTGAFDFSNLRWTPAP
ncbi:hypothetical protein [Sphingopyxis panaciterrulae]|uniref:Uncharacterized protein n=1 Tax=Sphingopyxis panaciterrulae TaxID=462372 RepID=A0A7W9EPA7_9SPHN|nr:hypothetical protein [Sphingopyxis panaciterrulae]MBB5705418.1 hypothetical protein [Sphingopyxis panaciterrulae]